MKVIDLGNGDSERVPDHWQSLPLRRLLKPGTEGIKIGPFGSQLKLGFMEDNAPYKVYGQENVISNDFGIGEKFVGSDKFRELVACEISPGDVVVTMMGTAGRCAVVPSCAQRGIMDSHLLRLRANTSVLLPHFAALLLDKSSYVRYQLLRAGKGSIMQGLNSLILKETILGIPPIQEQHAILAFIDREATRIDELIDKKRRLIQLLDEQHYGELDSLLFAPGQIENLFNRLLGTDRHSMNEQDNLVRLKFCLTSVEQGWSPQCYSRPAEEGEWGVLKAGCANTGDFNPAENKALPPEIAPIPELEIASGDVIVSRANTRELLGSAAYVYKTPARLLLCDKLYRLRTRQDRLDPEFLALVLRSKYIRYQMEREATGSSASMQNIGQDTIKNLLIPILSLPTQRKTVLLYRRMQAVRARITTEILRGIECLQQYRESLITASVTGQIDTGKYSRKEAAAVCQ
jgi:type I restriction enzyme S subunit